MARPTKKGFDYFSLDVSFHRDIKIRKLLRRKGGEAITVYIILLCFIYENGYYLSWDDDLPFVLSEDTGLEEDRIIDIIQYCIEVGLFNKELFEKDRILTSHSIQERYKSACIITKRVLPHDSPYQLIPFVQQPVSAKKARSDDEPMLVFPEETPVSPEETPISSEETIVTSEETPVSSEFSTQRKEKKNKINNIPPTPPSGGKGLSESDDVVIGDIEEPTMVSSNPSGYEKFDLSYIDDAFREPFFRWLEYKRSDQSFKYRSEKSIKTCYNSLIKLSGNDSLNAMLIVEQSITNGWKGLFNLKQNNYATDNNNGYRSREDIIKGVCRTTAELIAEGQQPHHEIPVV